MFHLLDVLTGNDFEAVETCVLMMDSSSGVEIVNPWK
jgi:hypothetical protein